MIFVFVHFIVLVNSGWYSFFLRCYNNFSQIKTSINDIDEYSRQIILIRMEQGVKFKPKFMPPANQ